MSISSISAGLLTTIQDLGRPGYQREGMVVGGAMDAGALRLANGLVGNPEAAAGLEITLAGPKLRFESDHILAITGADLSPTVNGEPVPMWRPMLVRKGSMLAFGRARSGCRAYLAVAGSFALPPVLGSLSTYAPAQLGGLHGRALHAGDTIPCVGPPPSNLHEELQRRLQHHSWTQARWALGPAYQSPLPAAPVIRAVRGPEYALFSAESHRQFWTSAFTVSAASDRMGYRLLGPSLLLQSPRELLSSAVTFGTVQVPADGAPIVLMADHQTTGGYPRLAQVISADFSWLAQLPLGQRFFFQEVTLAEAHALYFRQEHRLQKLHHTLRFKTAPHAFALR